MTKNLTLQDYQSVSAYLDNASSPRERTKIEARLAADPELRRILQEFKYTRHLLRAMPVRKAPRNFTLSAAKVPVRPQRFFLAPVLNFTAAAAALLLVVVFAGSNLISGFLGRQTASEAMSPMAASVAQMDQTTQSSTPMIITWGQNGVNNYSATAKSGYGGGGGDLSGSTMGTSPLLGGSAPAPNATQPPTTEAPGAATVAPLRLAQSTDTSGSLILGVPSAEDQGKVIATSAVPLPAAEMQSGPNFTLIEIGLGVLAVLCLAVSFLLRKLH